MNKLFPIITTLTFVFAESAFSQENDNANQKVSPIPGGKYSIQEILNTDSLTGALRLFTTHDDPPQWKIDFLTRAHQVLETDENTTYEEMLADPEIKHIIKARNLKLLGGPMLGQITESSASVWVRTVGSAEVSVRISDGRRTRLFGSVSSNEKNDFSVVVPVTGLRPDSSYPYTVLIDGEPVSGNEGVIRTVNSKTTRIAFGSCPHRWGLGRQEIWEEVQERDNSALILLGDIAVQDRDFHYGLHRFDYLMRDLQSAWSNLAANVPIYAAWDDHDFMNNDRPRPNRPDQSGEPGREGIRQVFKTSWNNAHYGFGDAGGGIFHRNRIGPVDILMMDNRYFRGIEGPYLGEGQMKWLEEQLLDCDGPFIILSCGTLWNDAKGNGKDSWGMYDNEGRERILSFIEKHRIPGVLLISGDWHGARGYTIKRPSGYTFYEFQPASLGGRPGATKVPNTFFATSGKYAFGEFSFDTSIEDPTVTFRLMLEDGSEYYKQTFSRSQLTPPLERASLHNHE